MTLCFAVMSAFACLSVSAITLLPVGNWIYHEINNYTEVEIYDYTGTQTNVFTPYSNNRIPITTVGSNAFDGNTSMKQITLSKYITTVNHHAFLNCTALETVIFQDSSVTTINDYAFAGCTALKTIPLENTLIETVSYGTFMNCDSLTEITLPQTVTSIKENAFSDCDNLEKIVIPATVTDIDSNAFYNSQNIVIYCYKDSFAHRYAVNNDIPYVLLDAEPVRTYILGDIDGDNTVAIMDATRIQLILVERITDYTEEDVLRGDVERDGVLSIMDVTSIQRYVASYDDGYGIGETFEF